MFGVLIADGERLCDPGAYHDRLLLGLSGIMSEAELHQIKESDFIRENVRRLRAVSCGCRFRQELIHNRDGSVSFNPDEEVQERLRLMSSRSSAKATQCQGGHAIPAARQPAHAPGADR